MALILVTGATGKQGRSFISATRTTGNTGPSTPAFRVLALTRDKNSASAKELALEDHVQVVEGDLDDPQSVRKVFDDAKEAGGIWGVFCVLAFPGLGADADGEERQGKTLADLALEYNVTLFVFSSSERGGETDDERAVLKDRRAKINIEKHVRELGQKGLPWTIIRPTFFMENFEGLIGSVTFDLLKTGLKPDTKIQLIAVDDIGRIATSVFKSPEAFASQVVIARGDSLTIQEIDDTYKSVTNRSHSLLPVFLARLLLSLNVHTRELLSDIERVHQLNLGPAKAEIDAQNDLARRAHRDATSFKAWVLRRKEKAAEGQGRWNQVSIWRLVTGQM